MSASTAITVKSTFKPTFKRYREPTESPSPPSAKRPRSEDLKSLTADVHEVSECASPPSDETPRSQSSSPPVGGVSQVRDGQKVPPATTADTTTAMSESTLRIIAHKKKRLLPTEANNRDTWAFWDTITRKEHKRYYQETGQAIRMLFLSTLLSFS